MEPVEQSWRNEPMTKALSKPTNSSDDNSMQTNRSRNRLYLAPQSTIRRMDSSDIPKYQHGTRRRRPKQNVRSPGEGSLKKKSVHTGYRSDSSNDSVEVDEECGSASVSSFAISPSRSMRRKYMRRNQLREGSSIPDLSIDLCEDVDGAASVYTSHTHHSSAEHKKSRRQYAWLYHQAQLMHCRPSANNKRPRPKYSPKTHHTVTSWITMAVILTLLYCLYDARRKLRFHRAELHRYETERAHILEQMTWIDHAAKKVHQRYSVSDANTHTKLSDQLETLELRIQQNARDRIEQQFGEKPVQVSLALPNKSNENVEVQHLLIALSDDAPHAVSTFLQQVAGRYWDKVNVERFVSDNELNDDDVVVIQASTDIPKLTPVLEFVEKSRGCQAAGSVALRSLESDDMQMLVLKVRLKTVPFVPATDDVCIGTVLKGLYDLEQLLPSIPVVHEQEGPSQY